MGTQNHACIVAVRVRRKSRSVAVTAGLKECDPISAEVMFMRWLEEQDSQEKAAVLKRLFKRKKSPDQ